MLEPIKRNALRLFAAAAIFACLPVANAQAVTMSQVLDYEVRDTRLASCNGLLRVSVAARTFETEPYCIDTVGLAAPCALKPVEEEIAGSVVLVVPDFELAVAFEHGDAVSFEPVATPMPCPLFPSQGEILPFVAWDPQFPSGWAKSLIPDSGSPIPAPFQSNHVVVDVDGNELGFVPTSWGSKANADPLGFVITNPPSFGSFGGVQSGMIELIGDEQIIAMSYDTSVAPLSISPVPVP